MSTLKNTAFAGMVASLIVGLSHTSGSAQNLGNDPFTGGLVGAGVGGGLGAALGGEKGAKTGAIIGGVGGALQGLSAQSQGGYYGPQQPSLLQQNNPLAGGLVGAGVGGGLGMALGGERGARTGAIIGGVGGALGSLNPPQPRLRPVYAAPQPVYVPPAYYPPQPVYVPPTYYPPPPAYAPPVNIRPPVAARPIPTQFTRNVQIALINLGYNPGPVDGVPGRATRLAVESYQRDYGLPVTGVADAALLASLRRNGG